MTIFDFKAQSLKQLQTVSPSPQLDVNVFLEHFTGLPKTQLLLNQNTDLTPRQLELLQDAVEKRKTGLPVAYITGHKEFYGYDFYVNKSVLIPKPDTEILVEKAIDSIIEKIEARNGNLDGDGGALLTVCDMCTGSGCIGISVLLELLNRYNIAPGSLPKFVFADISNPALNVARENAERMITENSALLRSKLQFIQTNLFENVPHKFDVILTNPPYIPRNMVQELLQDGRSEPALALDGDIDIFTGTSTGDEDGLGIIRQLIPQAREHMAPHGVMIMETGEYNAEQAAAIAQGYGFKTELYRDLEGQLRGFTGWL